MKPSIPPPTALDPRAARVIWPIKHILDEITGARSGPLEPLSKTATLDEVITKINQLVARLGA